MRPTRRVVHNATHDGGNATDSDRSNAAAAAVAAAAAALSHGRRCVVYSGGGSGVHGRTTTRPAGNATRTDTATVPRCFVGRYSKINVQDDRRRAVPPSVRRVSSISVFSLSPVTAPPPVRLSRER